MPLAYFQYHSKSLNLMKMNHLFTLPKSNIKTKRSQWDSNPRPLDPESNAISTPLCDLICIFNSTAYSLFLFFLSFGFLNLQKEIRKYYNPNTIQPPQFLHLFSSSKRSQTLTLTLNYRRT